MYPSTLPAAWDWAYSVLRSDSLPISMYSGRASKMPIVLEAVTPVTATTGATATVAKMPARMLNPTNPDRPTNARAKRARGGGGGGVDRAVGRVRPYPCGREVLVGTP